MAERYQVIIVGGGPVGVGLAIDLGRRGVTCAVVERRTELSLIPKGQGLTQRTVEHFWFWGVEKEIRAARAMPNGYPIAQLTAYESLSSDYWHSHAARDVVKPYYFQANERLPQYATETVLRKRLEDFDTADFFIGYTATSLEDREDGVSVVIEKDGVETVLEGDYLVGCDGGGSMVREQANIARSGTNWGEVMALVVLRSPELHEHMKRFPDGSTYRIMHPDLEGYWMFFGRVDVGEGFFFHAPVPQGVDATEEDVRALLHRAAGFEFEAEIDHLGFWDLRVQVADRYRKGRVFIAGDAAHTHPPYGGFGLNNGLEDAVNLSWKLTAVLEGWGGDELLESYSVERQAVFKGIGEDIIGGWIEVDREFLANYSPKKDVDAFVAKFEDMAGEYRTRLKRVEPNYEGSSVVLGPPGSVCGAHGEHTFTARAGHHLPPHQLSSGRNVFEELGLGFTLLALDVDDAEVEAFEAAAAATNVPLDVIRDSYDGGREAYEARMILVRPDQHIVWVGESAPDDLEALFLKVTGRAA